MILTRPAGVLRLNADWLFIMARMDGEGKKKNSKDFKKAAVERQMVAAVDTFPF